MSQNLNHLQSKPFSYRHGKRYALGAIGERAVLFGAVLLVHLSLVVFLQQQRVEAAQPLHTAPLMVSLISAAPPAAASEEAAPAAEPEPVPEEAPAPVVRPRPKPRPRAKPTKTVTKSQSTNTNNSTTNTSNVGSTTGSPTTNNNAVVAARFDADYLANPEPPYPALAKRLREEGKVILRVVVSAKGTAEQVDIHRSSGSVRLDDAAKKTVKNWRFIPAKQGGMPIASSVRVPIVFQLSS